MLLKFTKYFCDYYNCGSTEVFSQVVCILQMWIGAKTLGSLC
jgi:hypothetical protein